jgi:HK97 family phage portal protein
MNKPTVWQRVKAVVSGNYKELLAYDAAQSSWYLGDSAGYMWRGGNGNTAINFAQESGPPDANAIVMACINWVTTTFPEAPLRVHRRVGDQVDTINEHDLLRLIDTPNQYYTGLDLWQATLQSYNLDGNAYWIVLLNGSGRPVEIWYEPNFAIRPIGSATEFISRWQVYRSGAWIDLDPKYQMVMHFRRGIDPRNQRMGVSRLNAAHREIYTDEEAAQYTATLLRNMGIPGFIVSPKGDVVITGEDARIVKHDMMAATQGDKRGEPIVMNGAADVTRLSFTPSEMDLGALRTLPEERISALMGVPAIVAGLGAGLDKATYSNFEQAREQGWRDNIIPTQRVIAMTLQNRLLPLLGGRPGDTVDFDLSQVRALQDDQNALYTRMAVGFNAGFIMRSEARQVTGWPVEDADKVYKQAPAMHPALAAALGADPAADATVPAKSAPEAGVKVETGRELALYTNGHKETG